MSTEQGEGSSSKQAATEQQPTERSTSSTAQSEQTTRQTPQHPTTPPKLEEEQDVPLSQKKPAAKRDQASESTSPSTPEDAPRPRQVIAVSASKGPAAFFNLARKFLVTDEECDLSALEGAIVSAVDAAHLLERSKLAIIVRVQTSYVSVEPKRRKSQHQHHQQAQPGPASSPALSEGASTEGQSGEHPAGTPSSRGRPGGSSGRELRRARIVITVKRTESYKLWLEQNPLQAIIAGDGGDDDDEGRAATDRATSGEAPRP